MTVASYNVRNFEVDGPYSTNPNSLVKILKRNTSDLIAFQEIVDTNSFLKVIKNSLPAHKAIFSKCGGYGRQKLTFVYNTKKFKVLNSIEDLEMTGSRECHSGVRPLLRVEVEHKKTRKRMWVILVHLKAGSKGSDIDFRSNQIDYIQSILGSINNYIILGDFNTTSLNEERGQYFKNFIEKNKIIHSSSKVECTSYWWGGVSDGLYYPSLLDHILISSKLASNFRKINFTTKEHCQTNSCQISTESELGDSFNNVSDHCPVSVKLTRK